MFRISFRQILLCIACAALPVACGDDSEVTGPPAAPTIAPTLQWAGGIVRVTVEGVEAGGTAPALTLDRVALPLVETGDGWAEYRLPGTARGDVILELGGHRPATFEVDVLGFRGAQSLGVALRGNLFVWPRTGDASVLGLATDNSGVIQVLPASLETRYLLQEPIGSWQRSVGPTYDANLLLMPRGQPEIWRPLPTPQVVDTLDLMFARHAMLLSDSVYVTSTHHDIAAYDPRTPWPSLYFGLYEESQGAVISPSGRFGAFDVSGSQLGPPVFTADRGEPAFHVDTMSHSDGVDFSPVGDTLYIVGNRRTVPGEHLVLAIDATTGEIVDGLDIGSFNPMNLLRDPHGPWLFVITRSPSHASPVMLVVDTRTMELVGEMVSEGYTGCGVYGCEGAVAVGPGGVFFVTTNSSPAAARDIPAIVLSFDGWPAE